MAPMKGNVLKANKSTVRKQKKGSSSDDTAVMRRKVKQTFAVQVEAFIKRYRPALEALAKR
jgi:hypothetical protein